MYLDEPEPDVLGRARAGDERAFLALYRAAQPDLLRYLSLLVGEDAETVAAATWEVVARDLQAFAGTLEGFRGWVAGVARRLALEHLAANGMSTVAGVPVISEVIPGRAAGALRMIASLPEAEAEAVALRSVMQLDEEASAEVLGVRVVALRRRARRGLVRLGARLRGAHAAVPVREAVNAVADLRQDEVAAGTGTTGPIPVSEVNLSASGRRLVQGVPAQGGSAEVGSIRLPDREAELSS